MKNLTIYDNGGRTLDQYTIVEKSQNEYGQHNYIAASLTGASFYQHGEIEKKHIGPHLGRIVSFRSLNSELQNKLYDEFERCQTLIILSHQCKTENGIERDENFTITKVIGNFEQLEVTNQYGQKIVINPNQLEQ